jgi:hypothetical protein
MMMSQTEYLMTHAAAIQVRRGAFSLLETVLAIGLSVGLVVGVFAAIDQFWRIERTGRLAHERTQIALAVTRLVETDLRSVAFQRAEAEADEESTSTETSSQQKFATSSNGSGSSGSANGAAGDGGTAAGNASSGTSRSQNSPATVAWGVKGTETELRLQVMGSSATENTPLRSGVTGNAFGAAGASTALRMIRYGTGVVASSPQGSSQTLSRIAAGSETGWQRTVSMSFPGTGAVGMGDPLEVVVVPEMAEVRFRYLGGGGWVGQWDAEVAQQLPQAIEATLTFREQPVVRKPLWNFADAADTQVVRVVLPVMMGLNGLDEEE